MATWSSAYGFGVFLEKKEIPHSPLFFSVAVMQKKPVTRNRQTSFLTGPHFLAL